LGADAGGGADFDATAVVFDDAEYDRQAEASSGADGFGQEERN